MGKKVREYKSGDFIFAKVKGYPAWPARVQKLNGKKYFVYFYGTGETANLPPNMIFDYAENKDKFLTKTVKRRDFNNGVKQIEHDFANNVPLEQVIGAADAEPMDIANDTGNDTANETMDDTVADTTADDTIADETPANITQSDTVVEDSDEAGPLVIDEGKKTKKPKVDATKTPAKDTPKVKDKEAKTPRAKGKKDEAKDEEEAKKEEEIVSRSGRKIRPKRYIDEQTEENSTLPSPIPKKRRGASPPAEKDKDGDKEKEKPEPTKEKSAAKLYNAVTQSELEDLKEPFKHEDGEKDNILIAYLPSGQYVGIKLFQSRPNAFKNESTRLTWDKQAASNSVTIKLQLERGHITAQSVAAQLVMDLNLTDEEKAALDKERETEEKKSRVQFLKTEMKLIELDAKIKTCLCLEKADTELCLKLLDELGGLDIKPLMLLKHPSCLETVKRMRAYVGNTPSWDLSESAAALFSKQAHKIRKQADATYNHVKTLFTIPEGVSFWEFFSERVLQFKKATAKLNADELLELVHEPLEMSMPSAITMKSAVDAVNEEDAADDDTSLKKKSTSVKPKKAANSTPSKPPLKRQSSRKQQEEKDKDSKKSNAEDKKSNAEEKKSNAEEKTSNSDDKTAPSKADEAEKPGDNQTEESQTTEDKEPESSKESEKTDDAIKDSTENVNKESGNEENGEDVPEKELNNKDDKTTPQDNSKDSDKEKSPDVIEKEKGSDKKEKGSDKKEKGSDKKEKGSDKREKASDKKEKASAKSKDDKQDGDAKEDKVEKEDKADKTAKEDKEVSEPRAKRSRESKKTEPPPRSPAKRKSKF